MAASVNPWTYADWNLTAQAVYFQTFGVARAEARARDAGTILGGPRPKPPAGRIIERHFMVRRLIKQGSGSYGFTGDGPPVDGPLPES